MRPLARDTVLQRSCLILTYWDTTSKLLADPFTAFETYAALPSFFTTSNPLFLYDFNSAGAPTLLSLPPIDEIRNGATATTFQEISASGAIVSSSNLLTTQTGALQNLLSQRSPELTSVYVSQLHDLNEQIRAKLRIKSQPRASPNTSSPRSRSPVSPHLPQGRALRTSTQEEEDVDMNLVGNSTTQTFRTFAVNPMDLGDVMNLKKSLPT
ncbi:hypothetical protein C8R46DRAFT_1224513 [Mycena filopes]|nr:hypothetical protein C8R46DRAFT_1224513 [Mycena filopes]